MIKSKLNDITLATLIEIGRKAVEQYRNNKHIQSPTINTEPTETIKKEDPQKPLEKDSLAKLG